MQKHPAQIAFETLPKEAQEEFIQALGRAAMLYFYNGLAIGSALGYGLCLLLS